MGTAQKYQSLFPTNSTKTIDKRGISTGRNSSEASASNWGKLSWGRPWNITKVIMKSGDKSTKKKLRTLWSFCDCADILHFSFSYSKCSLLTARTGSATRKHASQAPSLCVESKHQTGYLRFFSLLWMDLEWDLDFFSPDDSGNLVSWTWGSERESKMNF